MRNRSIFFRSTIAVLLFNICACQKEPEHLKDTADDSLIKPFAGTTMGYKDGPVLEAQFQFPTLIAAGPDKSLYVVEYTGPFSSLAISGGTRIRKIGPDGLVSTFLDLNTTSEQDTIRGIAVDKNGDVYISERNQIKKISSDGNHVAVVAGDGSTAVLKDGPALKASFWQPRGLAFDSNGCLYIMDTKNNAVRLFTGGKVSTLAGGIRNFIPDAPGVESPPKDGTGRVAEFDEPKFISVDEERNVYVAGGFFPIIRRISPAGVVTTVLKIVFGYDSDILNTKKGITVPHNGFLYFNSIWEDIAGITLTFTLEKIAPNGTGFTTIASNSHDVDEIDDGNGYPSATVKGLNNPNGMVIVDNTLYLCNTGEHKIRKVELN